MNQVEVLEITAKDALDAITVYWHNYEPGRGMVTITCWAAAWNCFFGGMSGKTIQEFFSSVSVEYLTGKLIDNQWQKTSKRHEVYLSRIVTAVKNELSSANVTSKESSVVLS